MIQQHRCGKCHLEARETKWQIGDVSFYKSLCEKCSILVYQQVLEKPNVKNYFGYISACKQGLILLDSTPCTVVKPDFSKEKATIKKGQIEEEVF